MKVNAKQNNICAIAAFVLVLTVGKACLLVMTLGWGWGFNRRFFAGIIVILSVAFVAIILTRDRH